MKRTRNTSLLFTLVALLALGLGACGSSDDSTSGSATSQDTRTSTDFRTPNGDNSIQTYGEEASAAEISAASVVLNNYLDARAKGGEWERQCSFLAKSTLTPLEELVSRSPQLKGEGCAEILQLLTGKIPAPARTSKLSGEIDALRVRGERAFALFHGTDGVDYFVPLIEEGGEWKVGALAPSELT